MAHAATRHDSNHLRLVWCVTSHVEIGVDSHENFQVSTKQREGEKQDTTVNFLQELQSPKGRDA